MPDSDPTFQEHKRRLRAEVLARRNAQTEKETVSRQIVKRLFSLPNYQRAGTVLFYVDVRNEVRTKAALPEVLKAGKQLVVPFCVGRDLELFRLWELNELTAGRFGILEPRRDLRDRPDRRVLPADLDFLIVPGVAFDREGGRMGHGHGFYDRLLAQVPPAVPTVGLAFECQMVSATPMEPHDRPLDAVITEQGVYSKRISQR